VGILGEKQVCEGEKAQKQRKTHGATVFLGETLCAQGCPEFFLKRKGAKQKLCGFVFQLKNRVSHTFVRQRGMKNYFSLTSCTLFALLVAVSPFFSQTPAPAEYPTKISAYLGIVHPVATFSDGSITPNFRDYYQTGMTIATIIRKHPKYAWNLELVGFVRAQDGISRANNLMLHPGVTFFARKNWAFTPRMGFESSGRYGPSLIIGKKMFQIGPHAFTFNWVNLLRFGNDLPTSYTVAVNLTCGF
jgi:hypothetical protein